MEGLFRVLNGLIAKGLRKSRPAQHSGSRESKLFWLHEVAFMQIESLRPVGKVFLNAKQDEMETKRSFVWRKAPSAKTEDGARR